MDILHLLVRVGVELVQSLAGRGAHGLLKVAAQTQKACFGTLGNAILCVHLLCSLAGLGLLVEGTQGTGKARREAMLVVQGNCLIDGGVGKGVPMSEILGDDAGSRLVLLGYLVRFLRGGACVWSRRCNVVKVRCRRYLYLRRTKLGVVKKESGLCCSGTVSERVANLEIVDLRLFLKGHGC